MRIPHYNRVLLLAKEYRCVIGTNELLTLWPFKRRSVSFTCLSIQKVDIVGPILDRCRVGNIRDLKIPTKKNTGIWRLTHTLLDLFIFFRIIVFGIGQLLYGNNCNGRIHYLFPNSNSSCLNLPGKNLCVNRFFTSSLSF